MTDLVPVGDIERIVGRDRHPTEHLGRAVSAEEMFYILHSVECFTSGGDLRDCPFSMALDRGLNMATWRGMQDMSVTLRIRAGELIGRRDLRPDEGGVRR